MWFYAALGMALISGAYTVISKHALKKIDPITFYWVVLLFSIPFIIPFAWRDGIPEINHLFIIGVAGSVVFYSVSKIIFYNVIQKAELSHVYPLISLGPIFTLVFGMLILSERHTAMEFVAMIITLIGVYVLNISSARQGLLEPFKILYRNKVAFWMLVSVVLGGIVSVSDKLTIINTFPQSTFFALLVQDLVVIVCFLPWIMVKWKTVLPQIQDNKKLILGLGMLHAGSNLLAFVALSDGGAGLVTAVFRTQVFFVLLFSFIFFKDRPKIETIVGSLIMISGLVLLKILGN